MLTVDEAREAILKTLSTLPAERVMLTEALGRVLAEPLLAPDDHPAFDNSAMDGYAVRWAEVAHVAEGRPASLPVCAHIPAGASPDPMPPGAAARIMTGAQMPAGADTVVMREDTDDGAMEENRVQIRALPDHGCGSHVRLRGVNVKAGQEALGAGSMIGGGEIGLLATFGRPVVSVVRRPVVAIIATGDELVEVGQVPGPGQIVNASGWMLSALVAQAGGIPRLTPVARDAVDETRARFVEALSRADLVVSIGGVSVGDFDVVKEVMEELCASLTFWRVKMKPGKPLAFGVDRSGVPLIGLPGNPASAFVSFFQFVRPAMRRALGLSEVTLPVVVARASARMRSTPERLDFQRGRLTADGAGGWFFEPASDQGSGNPRSMVGVTGLARIPVGCGGLDAGELVEVEVLP